MSDIVIYKRNRRAYIFGNSSVGTNWLEKECGLGKLANTNSYAMDAELIEDFVKSVEEEGLAVEVE